MSQIFSCFLLGFAYAGIPNEIQKLEFSKVSAWNLNQASACGEAGQSPKADVNAVEFKGQDTCEDKNQIWSHVRYSLKIPVLVFPCAFCLVG